MKCKIHGCEEKVFHNDLCILHLDLPDDESSETFKRIKNLKAENLEKRKKSQNLNFKGAIFFNANFKGFETQQDIILTDAYIKQNLNFENSKIQADIWGDNVDIGGNLCFELAHIRGSVSFFKAKIYGNILFDHTIIGNYVWFQNATIAGEASFNHATIGASVSFKDARINENLSFYAAEIEGNIWFNQAYIKGEAWFDRLKINGNLNFFNTTFENVKGQERAHRSAKIIWEKIGDREKADYSFYHEMEAKRKQKPFYFRYPEIIAQYIFGYGVYPSRLLFSFITLLLLFAFSYWAMEGLFSLDSLLNKLRFSFLTLIVPAYGVINAKTGLYGFITILEAVIGAFTWPTFIVTFARKYMR